MIYRKKPVIIRIFSSLFALLQKKGFLPSIQKSRELYLLGFFGFLFMCIIVRLFYLQVLQAKHYEVLLSRQHTSQSLLKANRGNIFVYDKSGKPIQLTENISAYNIFVDPKFIGDKERFIQIIAPVVYQHLCESTVLQDIDTHTCVKNVSAYIGRELLPSEPAFFYMGSGIVSEGWEGYDRTGYNAQVDEVVRNFTSGVALTLISDALDKRIYIGNRPRNYIGFFYETDFLAELDRLNLSYVEILNQYYVYINPFAVRSITRDMVPIRRLLDKYGLLDQVPNLERAFSPQENRYVRLVMDVSAPIADKIKQLKYEHYSERINNIPILHGLGLEPYTKRYYPYGSFLSHVLGFVNKSDQVFYGIEQYFDEVLRGKDGRIVGRSSTWIGDVGANEFEIEDVHHGSDIYLTVDLTIQKEMERIAQFYHRDFIADSVSIVVFDPFSGQVIASATAPMYDPNSYEDVFRMMPLSPEYGYLIDNETYMDVPVYIHTGGDFKIATSIERVDTSLRKYVARNIYGPQTFIDRNISMSYEPGSVFKAFTVGVGFDMDEIRFYDMYQDPGFVKVGIYTIANADKKCEGEHSFLHALVYSCNVGMVRIAQKVEKYSFYNYIEKLGFGKMTHIELANEDPGFVEGVSSVSLARFLNNTFGQGLLATPIQLAAAYAPLINGGYYVKPTIVAGTYDPNTQVYFPNERKIVHQIFKPETSEALKEALFNVIASNNELHRIAGLDNYTLGGKSGTSQISFRGRYRQGAGWTNGSFVGVVTKDYPMYIVVIQVRRPRSNLWGGQTAGRIFKEVSQFLVRYAMLES